MTNCVTFSDIRQSKQLQKDYLDFNYVDGLPVAYVIGAGNTTSNLIDIFANPKYVLNPRDLTGSSMVTAVISGHHTSLFNGIKYDKIITFDKDEQNGALRVAGTFLHFLGEMMRGRGIIFMAGIDFDDSQDRTADAIGINDAIKRYPGVRFIKLMNNNKIKCEYLDPNDAIIDYPEYFNWR